MKELAARLYEKANALAAESIRARRSGMPAEAQFRQQLSQRIRRMARDGLRSDFG